MIHDSPHVTAGDEPERFGPVPLAELLAEPKPPIRDQYGPWIWDLDSLALRHERNGYQIDLNRATTSGEVLDWIMQVNTKPWAGPLTIAWLVEAFDDILDPQAHLCSWGGERGPIDPQAVVARRRS